MCRVVAHRDEGITAISTAPNLFQPGRGGRKNPGAAVAAPGFNTRSKMPCLYWWHCGMMKTTAASR